MLDKKLLGSRRSLGSLKNLAVAATLVPALSACGPESSPPPFVEAAPTAELSSEHPVAQPLPGTLPVRTADPAREVRCGDERCAAARPPQSPTAVPGLQTAIARTGKRTRGSNSQLVIPQNLMLADVDADGLSDFIQTAGARLFVSHPDFQKTGVLHLYQERPIKRVLTGDFHGDGHDTVCTILDNNALKCYGVSPDHKALWWWFTQGSFINDSEDSIVADFDGDGRDDILIYPRAGGAYRMYSLKGDAFFNATPAFAAGNLGTAAAGLQLRAGDFNGDGRDDLLVANSAGQVLSYAAVNDGTSNTFWWAFTTVSGVVGPSDQLTVARIDNNATDDVVLHNRSTGATRFYRLAYAAGNLQPLTGVSTGQISTLGNSQLFWGTVHGPLTETGGFYREDAMVYDQASNQFVRSDARWDGSALTYWWVYSQYAPTNHTGWAAFSNQPFLVLKCKLSDNATVPATNQFYHDLFQSELADYWREISYGTWELSTSVVNDTWYTMPISSAGWVASTVSRWDRTSYCLNAYGGATAGYVNTITVVNGEGDAGNVGGRVLVAPTAANVTFTAHETGHTFGYGHSFDDTTRKNSDWSAPGEYFDFWDIMSAMAVYAFTDGRGLTSGPEMNAPYKVKGGFLPAQRVVRLTPATSVQHATLDVAAISRPEGNGALMVRIGADDNNYYTVEYREKGGFDQGIPRPTVLVHQVKSGVSYLITAGGGPERLVGSTSSYALGGRTLTVHVNSFATAGYTANVTIDY